MNTKIQGMDSKKYLFARFVMMYLAFSLSFFTAMAFSIDESTIIESPQYKTAQIDFQTDEPAITLMNITGPNGTKLYDISDEPSLSHTIIVPSLESNTEYTYSLFAQTQSNEIDRISSRSFQTTREEDLTFDFYGNIPEFYNENIFVLNGRTYPDALVSVYLNEEYIDARHAKSDGSFTSRSFTFDTSMDVNKVTIEVYDENTNTTWTSDEFEVQIDTTKPEIFVSDIPSLHPTDSLDVSVNISKSAFLTVYVTHPDDSVQTVEQTRMVEANQTSQISIPVDDGTNQILIIARDKAGNIERISNEVFVDTVEPEIVTHNIAELTPSYTSSVTIKGTVNKPNVDVIAQVDFRDERTTQIRNRNVSAGGTLWDDEAYTTKSSQTPNEEGTYDFAVDIKLAGDVSLDLGYGTAEGLDSFEPSTQTGAVEGEARIGLGGDGDRRTNEISLYTVDRLDRVSQSAFGEIDLLACGPGGEWQVRMGEVYPAMLQPDLIFRGIAQISFELELMFFGDDPDNDVQISSTQMLRRQLSQIDQTEFAPQQMLDPSRCIFMPSANYNDKTYVVCNLAAYPPERHENRTEAQRILEQDLGQVTFPLMLELFYTYENSRGESISRVHRECLEPTIAIDRRIPPDTLPSSFLNWTVNFLEDIIKTIDDILIPLRTAKLVTFGACFATMGVQFVSAIGEVAACAGLSDPDQYYLERTLRGCNNGVSCEELQDVVAKIKDENEDVNPLACATSINKRLKTEHFRNYVCDRIFCPVVPSAQAYIRDVNENYFQNPTSACLNVQGEDGLENPWSETARVTTADDVDISQKKGFSAQYGCGKEYNDMFNPSCLLYNPVEQSRDLETQEPSSGFFGFLDNLRFCKAAEQTQGQYFREGGVSYFRDEDGCYQLGQDRMLAEFEPNSGLRNRQKIINPQTKQEAVTPAPIPGGVSQCVETLPSGDLVYQPQGVFGEEVEESSVTYRPQEAIPYEVEYQPVGRANPIEQQRMLTKYTVDGKEIGIDSEGNYFDLSSKKDGKFTRIKPNDSTFFKRVCRESQVPGQERFGIYDESSPDCQPVQGPDEAKKPVVQEILIDPTANLLNAIQCGCIPAIEGYLQVLRNVLLAVKNCFQAVLLTGEFESGACRALLTMYVCDLIFEAIKCFFNAASALSSPRTDTGERGGVVNMFSTLQQAGGKVSDSVQKRYGTTTTYNALISNRRLLHAVCLAAFGYDFIPEIDQALSIAGDGFSINTTAFIEPATRRFVSFNPTQQGEVTFIYHVGYFLAAGSNINWRLEMKCSNDYSCNPQEGFEGGRCDCAYEANQDKLQPYLLDGGAATGGSTVGAGDGRGDLYRVVTAPIRYDKVRIVWEDMTAGDKSGSTPWRDISGIGDIMPLSCYFSLLTFRFACDHSTVNQYGDVFFVPPGVELNNRGGQYYVDETLTATVYANQNFEGVQADQQVPKFAFMRLMKNNQELDSWSSRAGDLSQSPIILGGFSFSGAANSDPQGRWITSGQSQIGSAGSTVIHTRTSTWTSANEVAYYIYAQKVDEAVGETVFNLSNGENYTISYVRVSKDGTNSDVEFQKVDEIQEFLTEKSSSKPSLSGFSISDIKNATYELSNENEIRLELDPSDDLSGLFIQTDDGASAVKDKAGTYFAFTQRESGATGGLCAPGVDEEQLQVIVTLHDGESQHSNAEPTAYNAKRSTQIFTYNGEAQQREIPVTLNCQNRQENIDESSQLDEEEVESFQECQQNRFITKRDIVGANNCQCGDELLFGESDGDETIKVCWSEKSLGLCSLNTQVPQNSECYCSLGAGSFSQNNICVNNNTHTQQCVNSTSGTVTTYACENINS